MELFPIDHKYPSGFLYFRDFLSREEEMQYINEIRKRELHAFNFHGFEAKRRVASFGYDYSFSNGSLSKGKEIPDEFTPLIDRAGKHLNIASDRFSELLLTEYPVGAVINWHRDAPPFDIIVGISLQTDCVFKMRPHDKAKQGRRSIISFPVERRSLYLLQGEARTAWQHSIAPVDNVRYSITLRTLR